MSCCYITWFLPKGGTRSSHAVVLSGFSQREETEWRSGESWGMGAGEWELGSGIWGVGGEEWEVRSGSWGVEAREWELKSGS